MTPRPACALRHRWKDRDRVTVHGLGDESRGVSPDLLGATRPVNLLGPDQYEIEDGAVELDLDTYGYRWFRVGDLQPE